MGKKHTNREIQELSASYALGVLDLKDANDFEKVLKGKNKYALSELQSFRDVVNQLGFGVNPLVPPSKLKKRLFQNVKVAKKSILKKKEKKGFLYVHSNEGNWEEVVKGVRVKNLFVDDSRNYSTVIVQMSPGAKFPSHRHRETEECYIISGDLYMGGKVFHTGDYIRVETDSIHEGIYSKNGCTLLVMSSLQNEMLGQV